MESSEEFFLEAARSEERVLLARLRAVRAVITAYGGGTETRSHRSPVNEQAVGLLTTFLDGRTTPTTCREMLTFLEGRGVTITGLDPRATLSAVLSRSHQFRCIGREGWVLNSTFQPNEDK